jgi:hypothetical protein
MPFSPRGDKRLRGHRTVLNGGMNFSHPSRRRAPLMLRLHTWDQQIVRLSKRVDELEQLNARLTQALADAVRICDTAIAAGPEPNSTSARIAKLRRFLLYLSDGIRCQLSLLPSRLRLSCRLLLNRFPFSFPRKMEPAVGWPFEPILAGLRPVGPSSAPVGTEHNQEPRRGIDGAHEEPNSREIPVLDEASSIQTPH